MVIRFFICCLILLFPVPKKLHKNHRKEARGQKHTGVIYNSQDLNGKVMSVHVRSQNLGTHKRSDN